MGGVYRSVWRTSLRKFLNFWVSDLIHCIWGDTDWRIHFSGVSLLREDNYFLLNIVILLIFTFERDYHWGTEKLSLRGQKEGLGGLCSPPPVIQLKKARHVKSGCGTCRQICNIINNGLQLLMLKTLKLEIWSQKILWNFGNLLFADLLVNRKQGLVGFEYL